MESAFPDFFFVDSSRIAHQNDFLIENDKVAISFEIKNKQLISKEDLEKFERDCEQVDSLVIGKKKVFVFYSFKKQIPGK